MTIWDFRKCVLDFLVSIVSACAAMKNPCELWISYVLVWISGFFFAGIFVDAYIALDEHVERLRKVSKN